MRTIKFRCWDIGRKKFILPDDIDDLPIEYSTIDGETSFRFVDEFAVVSLCQEDDLVFQQFTGLLDVNGKEIYEGDILKEQIGNFTYLGVCKQVLGGWKIFAHSDTQIVWTGFQHVVVGNIFQNPELLTK